MTNDKTKREKCGEELIVGNRITQVVTTEIDYIDDDGTVDLRGWEEGTEKYFHEGCITIT